MSDFHEIIRIPDGGIAWVYLFSENHIREVTSHWHHSLELTLICEGQASYTINGRTFYPQKGDIVLINCGDLHKCSIAEQNCEGINIMIPNSYLTQFSHGRDTVFFWLDKNKPDFQNLVARCEKLYHVFAIRGQDPYAQMLINSIVSDITYLLFSSFRSDDFSLHSVESKKYRQRCREMIEYIDANFREGITMEHMMRALGISKEHLARIFREYMGTTFKNHLTRTRMYYAYRLLTTSDLTITQIALDSGFSDSRAFIASFRKVYGTTPGKYRQKYFQNLQIGYHHASKPIPFFSEQDLLQLNLTPSV